VERVGPTMLKVDTTAQRAGRATGKTSERHPGCLAVRNAGWAVKTLIKTGYMSARSVPPSGDRKLGRMDHLTEQ